MTAILDTHETWAISEPKDIYPILKDLRGRAIARYEGSATILIDVEGEFEVDGPPFYGHVHPLVTITGRRPERMTYWHEFQKTIVRSEDFPPSNFSQPKDRADAILQAKAGATALDVPFNEALLKQHMPTKLVFENEAVLLYAGEHLKIKNMLFLQSQNLKPRARVRSAIQMGNLPECMGVGASITMETIGVSNFDGDMINASYGGSSWSDSNRGGLPDGEGVVLNGGQNSIKSQYSEGMQFHKASTLLSPKLNALWLKGAGQAYITKAKVSDMGYDLAYILGNSTAHMAEVEAAGPARIKHSEGAHVVGSVANGGQGVSIKSLPSIDIQIN